MWLCWGQLCDDVRGSGLGEGFLNEKLHLGPPDLDHIRSCAPAKFAMFGLVWVGVCKVLC
jgi:hypothetical protein